MGEFSISVQLDVLVVDDEGAYCEYVQRELESAGHVVRCAHDGRTAIDAALERPPELLICDWILPGEIHGLQVAEAIRVLRPDLATVLITGFSAPDVAALAEDKRIAQFIEKPFDGEALRAAVADAVRSRRAPAATARSLGVLALDDDGTMLHRCDVAAGLLAGTRGGADAANFADCFEPAELPQLEAGRHVWLTVAPAGADAGRWELRARRRQAGGWTVVVRAANDGRLSGVADRLVGLLMADERGFDQRCPCGGRVMIVDDEELIRRVVIGVFERLGCVWHAADTHARAIDLIERDPHIEFVFLDYDMPDGSAADVVRRMRALRPDLAIVGTSGRDRRREFAEMGIERFLPKPWRANDLVAELAGRIAVCPQCGAALPLRRARRGETAERWECRGCGRRIEGVLDADADPAVRRNAMSKR